MKDEKLAEMAYNKYKAEMEERNVVIQVWEALTDRMQRAWIAAVRHVTRHADDGATGEIGPNHND